uniref:Uncharacterized protein n=1 Tax=Schistocephalus solidus TaxID=70667 RepID=A0A0X3PAN4_SCHSO
MVSAVFNKAWSGYLRLLKKYPLQTQCISTGSNVPLLVQLHRPNLHGYQGRPFAENGCLRPGYCLASFNLTRNHLSISTFAVPYGSLYGLLDNRSCWANKKLVH